MKLEHFLTPYTKIHSKWITDLHVRPETIKLLEENISKTLNDINQSKILYDPPPRAMEIKTKVNKWDLIKFKSFCTAKETISKVKRQPSEWKKIREIQIKTTMRYHLTSVRMAIITKSTNNQCWKVCGEKGIFLHCEWKCKLVQPLWEQYRGFFMKTKNRAAV